VFGSTTTIDHGGRSYRSGRLTEQDRQRALKHDKDLLLHELDMPPTGRAGWVAPEVRPRVRQHRE
jgi:hypothetical protein